MITNARVTLECDECTNQITIDASVTGDGTLDINSDNLSPYGWVVEHYTSGQTLCEACAPKTCPHCGGDLEDE